jgi:hypothetical protein
MCQKDCLASATVCGSCMKNRSTWSVRRLARERSRLASASARVRLPVLVASTNSERRWDTASPILRSEIPSPYWAAVSM